MAERDSRPAPGPSGGWQAERSATPTAPSRHGRAVSDLSATGKKVAGRSPLTPDPSSPSPGERGGRRLFICPLLALLISLSTLHADDKEPHGGPPEFKHLKYRSIGPAAGGRVCRAAGVPGDPLTYYAAVASSGIWKSSDGGIHWKPIFDEQPTQAVGSLAIAPSDANVIYVGSGEANIRGNVQPGNGIYKSTDAGKTWKHVWKQRGQIGTMLVHPTNPDIAYAAVLGQAFGPNKERGVYRTLDGGKNWGLVLSKDENTGASAVCFDPNNPRILLAGLWQARRYPWDLQSGGSGSGLHLSRDAGDSWTQLLAPPAKDSPDVGKEAPPGKKYCAGLPEGIWGKIDVAVAASDSRRIYALIEAEKGGLFRSDDGGDNWKLVNSSQALRQRAWYFTTLTIHPRNADVVFFPQVPLLKTVDGGKSLVRVKGTHHGDHHDLWIDPTNPQRMIDSNDGGVDVTSTGGETWYAPPLPICQFYHISVDNQVPYHIAGPIQDIGTASGPSNSLRNVGITLCDWHGVGGGETGFTAPDPADPKVVYAGEYGGYLSRFDRRTGQARSIGVYPYNPSGHAAADLKYRFQWTSPLLVSPHDPKVVYHAANVLFRSGDGGKSWQPISPDLTRNDKTKQRWAGGPITGDNTGVEIYGTIYALAESPRQKDLLWAGTDDGKVQVTRDGGKSWNDVTPREMPEWGTVSCIEPSPIAADTAYVTVDCHKLDDDRPYLFVTTDAGKSWVKRTGGVPENVYLRAVREDPKKKGLLYLGTSVGVFSAHPGQDWKPLKLNLPAVQVCDLAVKDNDLVVGTDGRSIWIFDDLTPIREWPAAVQDKEVYLFPPPPVHRYRYSNSLQEGFQRSVGANPPHGAILYLFLRGKNRKEVTLEISDNRTKQIVARLSSKKEEDTGPPDEPDEGAYSDEKEEKTVLPTESGLHRIVWDLRHDGAKLIRKAKIDQGDPRIGPLVNPGVYTLKLTADAESSTTTLRVELDPRERTGPLLPEAELEKLPAAVREKLERLDPQGRLGADELEERLQLALGIRDDINRLTNTVEQLRRIRKQIETRNDLLKDDDKAEPLIKASKQLLPKLEELEEKLHNPRAKVAYDILAQKGGARLYSQLGFLFEQIKDSDGPPGQGIRNVYKDQHALLEQLEREWLGLLNGEAARLNEQARLLKQPELILPKAPDGKKDPQP